VAEGKEGTERAGGNGVKMWMVKQRGYSHNWWNYAFTETTTGGESCDFLFYDMRMFPKLKWAKTYVRMNKLDHMEIVAVEVTER
jgi:hypothetical protein